MPDDLTPPVHPNCRCTIGADGVWYDAQDARVCPVCMLLGASWNLQLDIPMDEGEVARILDEKDLEDFRKAIEKDTGLRERVIAQAIEAADSGVAKLAVPQAGEAMQTAVEREIVKARAAARAAHGTTGAALARGGFAAAHHPTGAANGSRGLAAHALPRAFDGRDGSSSSATTATATAAGAAAVSSIITAVGLGASGSTSGRNF